MMMGQMQYLRVSVTAIGLPTVVTVQSQLLHRLFDEPECVGGLDRAKVRTLVENPNTLRSRWKERYRRCARQMS